jgi:NH3-dependent NAD+ synthetase
MTIEKIANDLKINKTLVLRIKNRWVSTEHKRRMPLTVKIGM